MSLILVFFINDAVTYGTEVTETTGDHDFTGTWISLNNEEYMELTPSSYYRKYVYENNVFERFGELESSDSLSGHLTYRFSGALKNGARFEIDNEKRFMTYKIHQNILQQASSTSGFPTRLTPVHYFKADRLVAKLSEDTPDDRFPLGWDLSYLSLVKKHDIGLEEWFVRWLIMASLKRDKTEQGFYVSPLSESLDTWGKDDIESSILLEYPAMHAAEPLSMWLIRTENKLYLSEFAAGRLTTDTKPLDPEKYDIELDNLFALESSKKLGHDEIAKGAVPGYSGVLSLYNKGKSKQILLNMNDIVQCKTEDCTNFKPGTLFMTIYSIAGYEMNIKD